MAPVRKYSDSTHGRPNKPADSAQMQTHVAIPKRKLFRGKDVMLDNYVLSSPGPQKLSSDRDLQSNDTSEDTDMEDNPPKNAYPVFQSDDSGEDTEMEDNSTTDAFYLHKQSQREPQRRITSVYGHDIRVWQSFGGTVYTCVEGEVVDGQAMLPRTRLPRSHKHSESIKGVSGAKVKKPTKVPTSTPAKRPSQGSPKGSKGSPNKAPTRAPALVQTLTSVSVFVPALTATPASAKHRVPAPAPLLPHRPRDPTALSTVFHHGSAAINPLGAHARPLHHTDPAQRLPNPPRPRALDPLSAPSVGNLPPKANPQLRRLVTPASAAPLLQQQQRKHQRITSGSFGTFEGRPAGRFDERGYRLFPTTGGIGGVKMREGMHGSDAGVRQEQTQDQLGAVRCSCGRCCGARPGIRCVRGEGCCCTESDLF